MAKKTRQELLEFYSSEEGQHKINTIRNGLLNNTLDSFPQMFATIKASNIQTLLGKEFYAFEKMVNDPGKFTLNEIEFLSSFFNVDFDIMFKFIRKAMIQENKKGRRKKMGK
jgi:hypothetical protein